MFHDIYTSVTNIPALAQGIVSAGLFMTLVWGGQRLWAYGSKLAAGLSRAKRINYLIAETTKLRIYTAHDLAESHAYLSILVYRALRSLFKAMIYVVLGLLANSIDPIFGVAGYIGALFYLFEGLNTVRRSETVDDREAKLEELEKELESLQKQT